jgi:hypothetical protein
MSFPHNHVFIFIFFLNKSGKLLYLSPRLSSHTSEDKKQRK